MLQENSWKVSRALVNTYPRVNSLVNAVWSVPDNMNHHLFLPVLNGPHPYHLYPPEEHQQRAAPTAPLSFSLAVFLSCWGVEKLLLPATIFLRSPPPQSRGNAGSVYQHSPAGPIRVGQRDWGVQGVLWLTVLIITVMGAGWGKREASSCFINATTSTLHSGGSVSSEWVSERTGRTDGVKSIGRRKGDAHCGLARRGVREDKCHSPSASRTVKYLLWRNTAKLQSGDKVRRANLKFHIHSLIK